jgi:two-component system cell cycle sensor histidine kinase/response regulator CckA
MTASILVVEDEAIIADDLERTLTRLGYRVPLVVAEGELAIAAARQHKPSLVLMDIKLKGATDGIDAAHIIQRDLGIPIVFLTSHSDSATLARASAARPSGYVMKPFIERDLRVSIEIALQKRDTERALHAKERWFSTTLNSLGDGVLATDERLVVTFVNQTAERLTGWTNQEATGKGIDEVFRLLNGQDAPIKGPAAQALSAGATTHLTATTKLVQKDGSTLLIDDSASPIIDDQGRKLGVVLVFRDATERKELELRVARSERLASLGTMAAGLCHEINNPLASLLFNIEHVLQEAGTPLQGDLADCLQEALEAAKRINDIVKDMKAFAKPIEDRRTEFDLRQVLDSAIKLTAHVVRQHARIEKTYHEAPRIFAELGRLTQVFVNLIINAAQAITAGDAQHHVIKITLAQDASGAAVVEIQDDGAGISPELLPRIFDPFFTTKNPGGGMGLGLSICNNIIHNLGGEINVRSTLGVGTTFQVKLFPVTRRKDKTPAFIAPVRPSRGKILVVDDEENLAHTLARILSKQHVAEFCNSGQEALEKLRTTQYDVILCDVMMPNMSGTELYELVAAQSPTQADRFVFITGGALTESTRAFLSRIDLPILMKPLPNISEFLIFINGLVTIAKSEANTAA